MKLPVNVSSIYIYGLWLLCGHYLAEVEYRASKYKTLRSACEVLVVRNTKGEQWTAKPQAHRKQNIRALYLEAQVTTCLQSSGGLLMFLFLDEIEWLVHHLSSMLLRVYSLSTTLRVSLQPSLTP